MSVVFPLVFYDEIYSGGRVKMNKGMKKLLTFGITLVVIGGLVLLLIPKNNEVQIKTEVSKVIEKEDTSDGKSAFKGMEVYIFDDNGREKYLLKAGTNYNPSREELLAFDGWTENLDDILEKIVEYEKDTYIFVFYDKSIDEEFISDVKDKISSSIDSENISLMESGGLENIENIEIEIVKPE